jgi:amino acid adenylation domain-containing protein
VIGRENLHDLYPLAPMQEGMLFHWLLSPQSEAYREQIAYRLRGTLDVACFEACWNQLARRHAILRTVFVHEKVARPLQMVLKKVTVPFHAEDLRRLAPEAQVERVSEYRREARGRGFDLARELPYRVAVLQLEDERFEVVWTFHHIILDGWSVGLLLADLLHLYSAGGEERIGSAAPLPYSHYIKWLATRDAELSRQFWRERLAGYAGPASIPSSRPGWLPDAYQAAQQAFAFSPEESLLLERFAIEREVTPGSLVQALWAIILGRYQPRQAVDGGRHDMAFGVVVSGRPPSLPGVEAMVGLFTNTIALRVGLDEDEPLSAFLVRLQSEAVAAQEHAYLPLAELQTAPGMIDHLVAYENYPRDAGIAASVSRGEYGFHIESVDALEQGPYDLNVVFAPGERLSATFYYNASRYAPEQIARLFAQMCSLAAAAMATPHARIADLDVLPVEERALLRRFTSTCTERTGPLTIHETIAQHARVQPDAPAIIEGGRALSYAELDELAGHMATVLRTRLALVSGARVVVVLERCADLPLLWLAILRAGGVYVPVDPVFPDERIALMVKDSECTMVLTSAARRRSLSELLGPVDVHDLQALTADCGNVPLLIDAPAQESAYVIYTSGSTGTPKGVSVGHAGVLNVMAHLRELLPIGCSDRVVFFASPSFDASIWEMCVALCHGAALVVADRETVSDPARFGAFLRRSECTITVLPPSYIRLLDVDDLARLNWLAAAGEATHPDTADRLSGRVRFVNLYGPTEASIMVTSYVIAPPGRFSRSVPIGSPIPNIDALVVDGRGRMVPIGAPGELCVGGVCVAHGYLNRPQLTAERFPAHPLLSGQRMYRTGDIVRWLDDGTLEFAGRGDDQVKVRGHRVELGEIEACLLACPGVRQAGVIFEQDEEDRADIIAYVVPEGELQLTGVRQHLRRMLPEYMVPSRLMKLDVLPLTPQGKLDRAALPRQYRQEGRSPDVPRDALEMELAAIWCSVLGAGSVGIHDSFFDLGGHSLTAVRLAAKIRKDLGHAFEVRDLFQHPTVAGLAAVLRGKEIVEAEPIACVPDATDYAVSHAQQRLWLLHHLSKEVAAYNIAGAFALEGAIDVGALRRAAEALVARHEVLRANFVQIDGQARQRVNRTVNGPVVEYADVSGASDPRNAAMTLFRAAQTRSFDLERDPLVRFLLINEAPSRHLFAIVLHHIVADGWSLELMAGELSQMYESNMSGCTSALPPLAVQNRDVSAWLNARSQEAHAMYWQRQLGGVLPVLDLPTDRPRPPQRSYRGATRSFSIPPATYHGLSCLARAANASLSMALIAVVKTLLVRYSNQLDIIVGHPTAGREHPDLDGQVGFFVNTIALRDVLRPEQTFVNLLSAVRQTVFDGLAHQAYPFDQMVEELGIMRDASRHPVFDVMVAYDRSSGVGLELSGVSVHPLGTDTGTSKFDLLFSFNETATSLEAAIEYSTDLFEPATIDRMQGHLLALLAAVVDSPDTALAELPMLTAGESGTLQPERVVTAEFGSSESLVSRFARMVLSFPECVAVVAGAERLTYRDLDARATVLACELVGCGDGRHLPVGLFIDRSADMLVAMLGILKAGSAYLPLDPALPVPRLKAMLTDANALLVVSHSRLGPIAEELDSRIVWVDRGSEANGVVRLPEVDGRDLAYVMYTSGSTGTPNGVLIEHHNVLALLDAYVHLAPHQDVLAGTALCPFSFDVSVWEIFSCLCFGGTLHVLDNSVAADHGKLVRYFRDHRITSAYLPPALIDEVADELDAGTEIVLDRLLVGVEPIRQHSIDRLQRMLPDLRIVNGYGPTETTVCATFYQFEGDADPDAPTPIGRAARGYEVHLLDAAMQIVPCGLPGEIYVGGVGLARGYAGRASLTAQRFVPNPFAQEPGERMYKTGDLGRMLPDGNIQFLGRADHQVKVRGFRVEPGEIEQALRAHAAVRDATVMVREAPAVGKQLVAYIASDLPCISVAELRTFLKTRLPDYMVPAAFAVLAALPRTANGKVDREALSAIAPVTMTHGAGADPVSPTETLLQQLWAEVLHVDGVGCEDDFFDLGGHSLLATRLLGRMREVCGVELPLRELFESPTVRAVAARVDAAQWGESTNGWSRAPIQVVARLGALPLSFAQQRLWFLEQIEPGPTYNVPMTLELDGELDAKRLEHALNEVMARHEALRTRFFTVDGMPAQEVLSDRAAQFTFQDLSTLDASAGEGEVRNLASNLARRPFDLGTDTLVRAILLRIERQRHVLLLCIHHIVIDGWSAGVLMRDLSACYAGNVLPALALQYADFAAWQRDPRHEQALSSQLDYWRVRLADLPPLLALPTDHPRAINRSRTAGFERFVLKPELVLRMQQLGRDLNATLFMTALAALDVLLARLSGQGDIAIGTPIANRARVELAPLIGFFANTVVIRVNLEDDPSFADLVGRVRAAALGAYAHQDAPFEQVVEALQPSRSLGHTPLFQVLLLVQNAALDLVTLPGLSVRALDQLATTAKFDLTLALEERDGGLAGAIEYDADLFDAGSVRSMVAQYCSLIAAVVADPQLAVSRIPLLLPTEQRELLEREARNLPAAIGNDTVTALVAAQIARTPLAMAVEDGELSLTYAELDTRSNQLAHHLRALGAGPNVPVGLCLPRSAGMLVALLGILKSGAAVVPLDPSYPQERQRFMLEEVAVPLLVGMCSVPGQVRHVDPDRDREAIAAQPTFPPPLVNAPDDLLYVLFTSGSTGMPKGVLVPHRVIVNLVAWGKAGLDFAAAARTLQFAPICFDVSFQEIFSCWVSGGTLVVIDDERRRDASALLEFLREACIERLFLPFVALQGLAEAAVDLPLRFLPTALRQIVTAGEQLRTTRALIELFTRLSACELHNHYGPTETHVIITHRLAGAASTWPPLPPIGQAVAGARLYVLDAHAQPVPQGVPGELYVGGIVVALGYANRQELSAHRFVPDPFTGKGRLYRTGDLVRLRADGDYEFLGRNDEQVKIRGFRIEPAEIEAALTRLPEVAQAAVVLDVRSGSARLLACVVAAPGAEIDTGALRRHLGDTLPEYMLPSAFALLDEMPLTSSGKVNRRKLAVAELTPQRESIAPRTETERALAEIYKQVLEVPEVGMEDSFFELGGHSLLATRLAARVRRQFGVQLPLRRLFEMPSIAQLAPVIDQAPRIAPEEAVLGPVDRTQTLPLSFAQERLWFLDRLGGGAAYNMPAALHLTGNLDAQALQAAIDAIVLRHEILRTRFVDSGGVPVQIVSPSLRIEMQQIDIFAQDESGRVAQACAVAEREAQVPFVLAEGPLLRVKLLHLAPREHVLVLVLHHILADGWSIAIMTRELMMLYTEFAAGRVPRLVPLPLQYGDFACWQRSADAERTLAPNRAYWASQLAGAVPTLHLPVDHPRSAEPGLKGGAIRFTFDAALTTAVKAFARKTQVTLHATLLTAFATLLFRLSGQEDVTIGTPVGHRPRAELEPLIGLFLNVLPIRVNCRAQVCVGELCQEVQSTALEAFAHGELPFEQIVEVSGVRRETAHAPLFQVMFVLQNAPKASLMLPGVDIAPLEFRAASAKYDLTLALDESDDVLTGALEYARDIFEAGTVEQLVAAYRAIVAAMTKDSGARIIDLPLGSVQPNRNAEEDNFAFD